MSGEEYILKEEKIIEKVCRDNGVSPEAWISKNAESYQRKYIKSVTTVCRPWFSYKVNVKGGE